MVMTSDVYCWLGLSCGPNTKDNGSQSESGQTWPTTNEDPQPWQHVVEPSMVPLRDLVLMADTVALFAFESSRAIASRLLRTLLILSCTTRLPSLLILHQPCHSTASQLVFPHLILQRARLLFNQRPLAGSSS